jgi:hypothetical protein
LSGLAAGYLAPEQTTTVEPIAVGGLWPALHPWCSKGPGDVQFAVVRYGLHSVLSVVAGCVYGFCGACDVEKWLRIAGRNPSLASC